MILRGATPSSADLARFRTRGRIGRAARSSGIVPIYEVGEQRWPTVLHDEVRRRHHAGATAGRRAAAAARSGRLLAPICRAIHFAHERGVLHRDLKPSNILIDDEGRPHVSDFGLAKRVEADEQLTLSGAVLGTPSYMAPEQAAGKRGNLGPASDVYSLGTILYQMLTGRPPFQAASPVETVLMVLEQEPLPPRLLNPRADRELEMIALKCLQKPPELRYATAKALADDLEAYLADEPTAARSGLFSQVLARAFRETHHATVLENWGLLWMWHSLALLVTCLLTNLLQWRGTTSPWPYLVLWTAGLGTWAMIFWTLRRRCGPGDVRRAADRPRLGVEHDLDRAVVRGRDDSRHAGAHAVAGSGADQRHDLSGQGRHADRAVLFSSGGAVCHRHRHGRAGAMQIPLGITLFGVVSAGCFFFPGLEVLSQRAVIA